MRLIDADKLIEVFSEGKEVWRGNGVLPSNESLMWLAAMDITSNAPTIGAASVRHGRWENYGHCSCCGWGWSDLVYDRTVQMSRMNYCPNCGAKMDLEEHHD